MREKALTLLNRMRDAIMSRDDDSLVLSTRENDGRANSISHEADIVNFLRRSGFGESEFLWSDDLKKEGKTMNRHWWDILLFPASENPIPVNIKSTVMGSADNACSFKALRYCYATEFPREELFSGANSPRDVRVLTDLKKPNMTSERDYYFLVINKNDLDRVIVSSLKTIESFAIKQNPRNLPFQIKWKGVENRHRGTSSVMNDSKFYMGLIADTIQKDRYLHEFSQAHYTPKGC